MILIFIWYAVNKMGQAKKKQKPPFPRAFGAGERGPTLIPAPFYTTITITIPLKSPLQPLLDHHLRLIPQ